MDEIICPGCGAERIKLNGETYYGKQNHHGKICGQQFVLNSKQKIITDEEKAKTKKTVVRANIITGGM